MEVFAEAGLRGATTRRIAEVAGVNEVTLFRHFGSKERLLHQALHESLGESCVPRLPPEARDPRAELTEWCDGMLRHLYGIRSVIRTSLAEFEQHPEMSSAACETPLQVARELTGYLERLRARGLAADCDMHAASALLMGAIFSDATGRDLMPERFPYGLEAAAERYVELVLRAIGACGPAGASGAATGAGAAEHTQGANGDGNG